MFGWHGNLNGNGIETFYGNGKAEIHSRRNGKAEIHSRTPLVITRHVSRVQPQTIPIIVFAAGAAPWTPLGELIALSSDPPSWI